MLNNGKLGRYGYWNGRLRLFTNRNPKNGMLWSDDIGKDGSWIISENVRFVD